MFHSASLEPTTSSLDEQRVWQEITRIARATLRDARATTIPRARVRTRVRAAAADGQAWDVRAQPLLQAAHRQSVILVAVERLPTGIPSAEEVRERFGLSRRQSEVATLLARRLSDKEIAAKLGIAHNTVRRHVELVMLRLRVHSRTEVADIVMGSPNGSPALVLHNG